MKIKKRVLAQMDGVYAVCSMNIGGYTHFLAATEKDGKCLLFSPPDWKPSVVWYSPGGCMAVRPIPGREKAIVAIQQFYPIFRSEKAVIAYAEMNELVTEPWRVRRVIELPFVHRIETFRLNSVPVLVASTLCSGKAFQDDWSQKGSVYAGLIPKNPSDEWSLKPILSGLSKNHGMNLTTIDNKPVIMVSGTEGLFVLWPPEKPDLTWHREQLLKHEVSDIFTYDIDGDSIHEIVTIEPFHGDKLVLYKKASYDWEPVFEATLEFGHVVWAGKLCGRPVILGASRSGSKELLMLFPKTNSLKVMAREVLDENVGTTQMAVIHKENSDLIISANHAAGEIALYELTP